MARDASVMRNHVLPRWGSTPLGKIDHLAVQAWVSDLGSRLSPATVAECHRLVSGVLRPALRDRVIGANPAEGVKVPARRKKDTDGQTISRPDLIGRLLPAVPDRYRALVGLAGGTGLRWGECVGMRWDCVDLDAKTVEVIRVAVEVTGRPATPGSSPPGRAKYTPLGAESPMRSTSMSIRMTESIASRQIRCIRLLVPARSIGVPEPRVRAVPRRYKPGSVVRRLDPTMSRPEHPQWTVLCGVTAAARTSAAEHRPLS